MRLNEDLAEVVGVFIGDGCMSEYLDRGRKRCLVMLTGHCMNDKEYYVEQLCATMKREFDYERKLYFRKDDHTIRYVMCARRIVDFFKDLGMPIGEKGDRIKIPAGIACDEKLSLACIRGIFNADGSVYRRYSRAYAGHARVYRNYAVIQFKMKNHEVVRQMKEILEKRGIKVNRITRVLNCSVIRITEQKSVARFVGIIGFTHPYHEKRYLDICNREPGHLNYDLKDMPSNSDSILGL